MQNTSSNIRFIKFITVFLLIFSLNSCKTPALILPLDADIVISSYQKSKFRANRKYKKRELIIVGNLSRIHKNENGETIIIFEKKGCPFNISCTVSGILKQAKPFQQNEVIKIKGFCKGKKDNIYLENCEILE